MEKYKILVIEDNADVRENLVEILELAGYDVVSTSNGKDGVTMAHKVLPSLILCDIMMPGIDGYGVLYLLGKHPVTSSIPFVFLSAKADNVDIRKGMNEGADDYITKPYDEMVLLQAIETRLKRSQKLHDNSLTGGEQLNNIMSVARGMDRLKSLSLNPQTRSYTKKELIYGQDTNSRNVYYIEFGKVKCYKTNEDGKELITQILGEGDFFGYDSVIRDLPYDHSVQTMEKTECLVIPSEEFNRLISLHPEITSAIIRLLAERINDESGELLNLAYNSVRKRVALALVKLAAKSTRDNSDDWFSAARDDVAQMAGTATESVIRVMTEFKEDGLIDIEGRKIRLVFPDKLESLPY